MRGVGASRVTATPDWYAAVLPAFVDRPGRPRRLLLGDVDGEAATALAAAGRQDAAAALALHAGPEAVGALAALVVGLVGALHGSLLGDARFCTSLCRRGGGKEPRSIPAPYDLVKQPWRGSPPDGRPQRGAPKIHSYLTYLTGRRAAGPPRRPAIRFPPLIRVLCVAVGGHLLVAGSRRGSTSQFFPKDDRRIGFRSYFPLASPDGGLVGIHGTRQDGDGMDTSSHNFSPPLPTRDSQHS